MKVFNLSKNQRKMLEKQKLSSDHISLHAVQERSLYIPFYQTLSSKYGSCLQFFALSTCSDLQSSIEFLQRETWLFNNLLHIAIFS